MDRKILKIAIVTMMLCLVCYTMVSALSFTATMTPSSTTVPESTEFKVEIKVSNLDAGANGINALSGYLVYDDTVFEKISDSSIEGLNGWNPTYNAENSGKLTLSKTTFVKSDEKVFQVTFKTKTGVASKSGQIQFNNIVASNSEAEIQASNISTTITVGNAGDTANVTNTTNGNALISISNTASNTASNNTTSNAVSNVIASVVSNKVSNNTVSSYVNTTNTSAEEDIPYTGVEDTLKIVLGGVVLVAIVFYIKFERINKEMK